MNEILASKLREGALVLRSVISTAAAPLQKAKDLILVEIHRILTLLLGPPPNLKDAFAWEYHDKSGDFHRVTTKPLDFATSLCSAEGIRANFGADVHQLFSLVNDPRNGYNQLLTVSRLGNVVEGRPVTYVNVHMDVIKAACVEMLKAGMPVFFGCHAGRYMSREAGIFDGALLDYELGFNVRLGMSKTERLVTGDSHMTHAMVLTAVHVLDEKSIRWRVENSWGPDVGSKGYFVMTDAWMDEFVYQAIVDPRFVSEETRDVVNKKPIELPRWDPIGALA